MIYYNTRHTTSIYYVYNDRICETRLTKAASKVSNLFYSRLHGALGCLPPNLEAVAQAVFALRTTNTSVFLLNLLLLISKNARKGVAKVRGRALWSVYYYCVSPGHYGINRLQAD